MLDCPIFELKVKNYNFVKKGHFESTYPSQRRQHPYCQIERQPSKELRRMSPRHHRSKVHS